MLADAPVNSTAPWPRGSMRRTACWATRKAPKAPAVNRGLDLRRLQVDERPAGARRRVVDHDIGDADHALDLGEQALDLPGISGIASKGASSGRVAQCSELVGIAGREADRHAFAHEQACERGAETGTGADDESGLGLR